MENMKAVYMEEANELLANLEEALLVLDSSHDDESVTEEVFRIMHTLKGNSSMFGFNHLAEFIHNLETIYDMIRNDQMAVTKEIVDVTLAALDHIKEIIHDDQLEDASNKAKHKELSAAIVLLIGDDAKVAEAKPEEVAPKLKKEQKDAKNHVHTFHIYFSPNKEVLSDGSNPLYLLDELHGLGKCKVVPHFVDLPSIDQYEVEACYTGWDIFIATEQNIQSVKDVFVFVEGDSVLEIKELAPVNLLKDKKFVGSLTKEQFSSKSIDISHFQNQIDEIVKSESAIAVSVEDVTEADSERDESNQTAGSAPEKTKAKEKTISSIRVASDKLDEMMNLVSELVTTQAALSLHAEKFQNSELDVIAENVEKLSRQLRDNAFGMTLIPINNMFGRFQRMVRDISNELGKEVLFVTEGGETELDKSIIESLQDPLMHILRNSLDHGVETADERESNKKPRQGKILLKAFYSGANVHIQISDDGRGINTDKILKKAIQNGLVNENANLSDKEIYDLLFTPGFSTAEKVTDVSGRGVGMDVVRRNISDLRGEIVVESKVNVGTTQTIILPLTLSIIDGLLVHIGDSNFVIPLSVVDKCFEVPASALKNEFSKILVLDGDQVPYINLREDFNIESDSEPEAHQVIVVNNGEHRVGLTVDVILGEYQAVLKPLGDYYSDQDFISGSTILGDGTIALVFDTTRLIRDFVEKDVVDEL